MAMLLAFGPGAARIHDLWALVRRVGREKARRAESISLAAACSCQTSLDRKGGSLLVGVSPDDVKDVGAAHARNLAVDRNQRAAAVRCTAIPPIDGSREI